MNRFWRLRGTRWSGAICRRGSWLACLLLGWIQSVAAQVVVFDSGPEVLAVAPGGSTTLAFILRNVGSVTETVVMSVSGLGPGYGLVALSGCPVPEPAQRLPTPPRPSPHIGEGVRATTGSWQTSMATAAPENLSRDIVLVAGGSLHCKFLLNRSTLAEEDVRVEFRFTRGDVSRLKFFRAGDLARLEVNQTLVLPQVAANLNRVRVTVRNEGPTNVGRLRYADCLPDSSLQTLEVVGGECAAVDSATCAAGQKALGFVMTELATGTAKTCELKPGVQPAAVSLLLQELRKSGSGAALENAGNFTDDMVLIVPGGIDPNPIPAMRGWVGLALLGALLATARRRLR